MNIRGHCYLCQSMDEKYLKYPTGMSHNEWIKMALSGIEEYFDTSVLFVTGLCRNLHKIGVKIFHFTQYGCTRRIYLYHLQ